MMAYRSWLQDAKSIHDLGNHFYIPTPGKPWDTARDEKAEQNWLSHFAKPLPVAEQFKPYFGSRMHDAGLLCIERSSRELRVRLDSNLAAEFAARLARHLGVPRVERFWEVDLILHDPVYVRSVRYGPSGELKHSNRAPQGEGRDEFLYDWFFEQDARLQWVAQLWCRRQETHKLSPYLFLLVDASQATAEDRRAAAMEAAYGYAGRLLWEDAMAGIDTGSPPEHGIYGINDFDGFFRRRIAARGL